ncbi:MAG: LacI family DNA-binding transcriptional regulator [Spirochaetia bacterium]
MLPDTATVKDIAEAAGVTPRTVTNALRQNEKGVRADARARAQRIRDIAAEMGYRPHAGARAMRRGSYRAFGVLSSSKAYAGALNQSSEWGMLEEAAKTGYHITIGQIPEDMAAEADTLPNLIEDWMVDGMAISYAVEAPDALLTALDRWKLPAVWINVKRKTDAVLFDDYGDALKAVNLLVDLGHDRILYLDRFRDGPDHYSVRDRRRGYLDGIGNLEPYIVMPPPRTAPNSRVQLEWAVGLLRRNPRPTAVIGYSLDHALWFREAAFELGLRVPDDLSIIGFSPAVSRSDLPFTPGQILQPDFDMGRTVVRMLIEKIRLGNAPFPSRVLSGTVIPGDTVRKL